MSGDRALYVDDVVRPGAITGHFYDAGLHTYTLLMPEPDVGIYKRLIMLGVESCIVVSECEADDSKVTICAPTGYNVVVCVINVDRYGRRSHHGPKYRFKASAQAPNKPGSLTVKNIEVSCEHAKSD